MLEHAQPAAARRKVRDGQGTAVIDPEDLAWRDVADESRAYRFQRASLARHEPRVAFPTEAERTHAERVTHRVERGRREDDE